MLLGSCERFLALGLVYTLGDKLPRGYFVIRKGPFRFTVLFSFGYPRTDPLFNFYPNGLLGFFNFRDRRGRDSSGLLSFYNFDQEFVQGHDQF